MVQDEMPFTPDTIDTQLEDLEAALQERSADHPKTPNMQVIAALQEFYTAEQLAHDASLRQVRQRLLRSSQATSPGRLSLQRAIEQPGRPDERRGVLTRSICWRGGLLTRLNTIAAAVLITLLVGGLVAGLILVRLGPGGSQTGQAQAGVEVRLQPTCAVPAQHCTPGQLGLLPQDRAILAHRLQDALGASSAIVRLEGSDTIVVDLPPLAQQQQQETIDLLSQTGLLNILDTGSMPLPVNQPVPPGATYPVAFTGAQLDTTMVRAILDPMSNQPEILFGFKGPARSAFASYTEAHIGYYLTISLDGIVIESAVIQSQISGQGVISGGHLTLDRAQYMAVLIRSGALPLPLTVVSTQTSG